MEPINLLELEQTCYQLSVERPTSVLQEDARKYVSELLDMTEELERKLKEQSLRNEEFEARLRDALKDVGNKEPTTIS